MFGLPYPYPDLVDVAVNSIYSAICIRLLVLIRAMGQKAHTAWVNGPGSPRTTWQYVLVPMLTLVFTLNLIGAPKINATIAAIKFITFTVFSSTCASFVLLSRAYGLRDRVWANVD